MGAGFGLHTGRKFIKNRSITLVFKLEKAMSVLSNPSSVKVELHSAEFAEVNCKMSPMYDH